MSTPSPSADLGMGLAQTLISIARDRGCTEAVCEALGRATRALVAAIDEGDVCIALASVDRGQADLRSMLLASGLVASGEARQALPLVLDVRDRLYLYRFFDYERRLAKALRSLAAQSVDAPDHVALKARLDTLFADNALLLGPDEIDDQKLAAALAMYRPLTIVSGGPGTGKTTTVVAILACLLAQHPELRIAVTAPTGKAAARLLAAIGQRAANLDPELRDRLPNDSFTLHRLLGPIPDSGRFRHDRDHPLALDVLVVDEASMLDLAMATKLVEALPRHARLILLGDKDQLAAVEAGAVFQALSSDRSLSPVLAQQLAQVCGVPVERLKPYLSTANTMPNPLCDSTVWFGRNFRFGPSSPIGTLARAIRDREPGAALAALSAPSDGSEQLVWIECPAGPLSSDQLDSLTESYREFLNVVRSTSPDPKEALAAFERHRILCALRRGARGVDRINLELTHKALQSLGMKPGMHNPWYPGRPVIVTENDYGLGIFNGDIGITLPDREGRLMVWFSSAHETVRAIAAARLPAHQTAYAITIHKAQGSEFDAVSIILPSSESPLLTRELIYTATTRARHRVTLLGQTALLSKALTKTSMRDSGLAEMLVTQL